MLASPSSKLNSSDPTPILSAFFKCPNRTSTPIHDPYTRMANSSHQERLLDRREYDELTKGLTFAAELMTLFENRLNIPSRQRMTMDHLDHCYQAHDYRFMLKNVGAEIQLLAGRLECVYEAFASQDPSTERASGEVLSSNDTVVSYHNLKSHHILGEYKTGNQSLMAAENSWQSANRDYARHRLDQLQASVGAYLQDDLPSQGAQHKTTGRFGDSELFFHNHEPADDAVNAARSPQSSPFKSDVSSVPGKQKLQPLISLVMAKTHAEIQAQHQGDYDGLPVTFATFGRRGATPELVQPAPVHPMTQTPPAWINDDNVSVPNKETAVDVTSSSNGVIRGLVGLKSKSGSSDSQCF